MKTLTIWSNHGMSQAQAERVQAALAPHRLIVGAAASASELHTADIAFGQPPAADAAASPRLAWVHLTSAGYTGYAKGEIQAALKARGAWLTTSSGVYAEPCAEHVLAFMLAWARRLPDALDEQRGQRGWSQGEIRRRSVLLAEQRVMLFGFGSIGARVAAMLAAFTPHVIGVRRSVRGDEPIETLSFDDPRVNEHLGRAHHVVNLLPGADFTARYFDATRIGRMAPGAVFYNVGRGSTVDQTALAQRLHDGTLAAALLDVTDPEPLPPEHPLWSTPNCFITPHSAGGHHDEGDRLVQHFIANFERFVRAQPLHDRVL
jgi:phosphoglycerate dehydrogenase-like enzyme